MSIPSINRDESQSSESSMNSGQSKIDILAENLLLLDTGMSVSQHRSRLIVKYGHRTTENDPSELLRLIADRVGRAHGSILHIVDDGLEVMLEISLEAALYMD